MKRDRIIITPATPEKTIPAVAERTIPAQPERRRTETDTICDVCEMRDGWAMCNVCGRDICKRCRKSADINRLGGDYSYRYVCPTCLALREKYHAKEDVLEEEHDRQDEALREEWKAESLKVTA